MYRILIADDEAGIREGVARYLRKHCSTYEVAETAENGADALKKAQELLPEVIITDIAMPRMNGLDFLEQIRHTLPDTKMIIVSGYDKFEYARQAMRLGVKEYLVKPLDTKKLLAALEELKTELDAEKAAWNRKDSTDTGAGGAAGKGSGECRETGGLGSEETGGPRTEKDGRDGGGDGQKEQAVLAEKLHQAVGETECTEDDLSIRRVALWRGNVPAEALRTALRNRFKGIVKATCISTAEEKNAIVFQYNKEESAQAFIKMNLGLTAVANHMKQENLGDVRFFLGGEVTGLNRLACSWMQARTAAEYGLFGEMPPVFNYEDGVAKQLAACSCPPEELLKKLVMEACYGNSQSLEAAADSLFTWFQKEQNGNAAFIRSNVLAVSHRILGHETNTAAITYLEAEKFRQSVMKAESLEELKKEFLHFLRFMGEKKTGSVRQEQSIAQKVDRIIQENIGNPEFSLDDVAGLLFISPNYLRQLFKQETGMTFVEYLTRTRMKQAKMLLDTGEVRVADVAEHVGYRDPRYFSSCFKKLYQISPSDLLEKGKS